DHRRIRRGRRQHVDPVLLRRQLRPGQLPAGTREGHGVRVWYLAFLSFRRKLESSFFRSSLARHSGESRNPTSFALLLLVIPAKAGIQLCFSPSLVIPAKAGIHFDLAIFAMKARLPLGLRPSG